MPLFVIGDLHLSLGVNKPMDVFGGNWLYYTERIIENWNKTVDKGDTVILCGDTSWGINLEQSLPDFKLLESLPGTKLLLKGNHDYFWDTTTKMERFFLQNDISSLKILHNNCYNYGDIGICGTRGWFYELDYNERDQKVFNRELVRLEASLKAANKNFSKIFVFLHYPPLTFDYKCDKIIELLNFYKVERCYFGHLHGKHAELAFCGEIDDIEYRLISSDYIDFKPLLIQ